MTIIIRNAAGEIKTCMETSAGTVLEAGETMEDVPVPFNTYAKRLCLSVDGRAGELVRVPAGSGMLSVRVDCPGETTVALDINGLVDTIPLVEGSGTLALSADIPGMFIICPADRVKYCAAGEAVCVVEVAA